MPKWMCYPSRWHLHVQHPNSRDARLGDGQFCHLCGDAHLHHSPGYPGKTGRRQNGDMKTTGRRQNDDRKTRGRRQEDDRMTTGRRQEDDWMTTWKRQEDDRILTAHLQDYLPVATAPNVTVWAPQAGKPSKCQKSELTVFLLQQRQYLWHFRERLKLGLVTSVQKLPQGSSTTMDSYLELTMLFQKW